MKRTKLAAALAIVIVLAMLFAACGAKTATGNKDASDFSEHTNKDQFDYINPEGTTSDINEYYNNLNIECNVKIRSTGGDVAVKDGTWVELPIPTKQWTIGFSAYYTIDEVGAMYLLGIQQAAEEIGVELLVNDADYDQNLQNQAIEQWILQGVDGVILSPCDYTGVQAALDALEKAKIPVITYDCPPQAGNIDSSVQYDAIEQGRLAGEALEKHLLDNGVEMSGKIFYGTLPFVHPNAVTREIGFFSVFEKYPEIEIVALTGESPEDHYTAFEGAIAANPDMIGAWGLYSSATYGMMNALQAAGREDIPLTSVDNDRVILEGIYEGRVLGSACYSAIDGSRLAMTQMINLLEGVNIPGIVYQENIMVTKDNVEEMFSQYYPGSTLEEYMAGEA